MNNSKQIQDIIDRRDMTDRRKASAILSILQEDYQQRSSDILAYLLEHWMLGADSLECLVDYASREMDLDVSL